MHKVALVTGANGFLGSNLCVYLASKGMKVKALHRKGANIPSRLVDNEGIDLVTGDIQSKADLKVAFLGVDAVFHLAAYAQVWSKFPDTFYNVNVVGTQNVLEVAQEQKVKKVICTATAGIYGPQKDGQLISENKSATDKLYTQYEQTKRKAAELALNRDWECEVVVVSPTRVYGPGELSKSNSITKIISQIGKKAFRVIPGKGDSIGNYVFIEDVIQAHYLAMINGRDKEDYIIGGDNYDFNTLFSSIQKAYGLDYKMYHLPLNVMLGVAKCFQFMADRFGVEPLITPPFIYKYMEQWETDISKAKEHLGYQPTPWQEGLSKTMKWLQSDA